MCVVPALSGANCSICASIPEQPIDNLATIQPGFTSPRSQDQHPRITTSYLSRASRAQTSQQWHPLQPKAPPTSRQTFSPANQTIVCRRISIDGDFLHTSTMVEIKVLPPWWVSLWLSPMWNRPVTARPQMRRMPAAQTAEPLLTCRARESGWLT
jgi:hypothetical protein